jgi:hypothetical protein
MQQKLTFGFSTNKVDQVKPNQRITFAELRDIITNRTSCPPQYDELQALAVDQYVNGSKLARAKLLQKKRMLPWVTLQGFCPTHHNDATLQFNGCLQIDWDIKTPDGQSRALKFLQKIKNLQPVGVMFAGISPSTFGVKILMTTTAKDKSQHKAAATQAIKYLADLFQMDESEFDPCSKTLSQPCFIPYERTPGQHFWQPDATKFDVCFLSTKVDDQRPTFKPFEIHDSANDVRSAVEFLQGSGKAWTANGRHDYLSVMVACKSLFSDGESVAWNILENCGQWIESTTRKQWASQWKSAKTNPRERGGVLFKLAYAAGWESPQQQAKRERLEAKQRIDQERKAAPLQKAVEVQPAPDLNNLIAQPGEYLAGVLQRHGLPLDSIIGRYVVSPTGSGKTSLIGEIVKRYPDRKVLVILPTNALINRVCERHPDAVKFVGGVRKLDGTERFIVSTANSFPALSSRINLREWDVFFDEAHGFTADTARGYKLKCLRRFHAIAKDLAKSITYLTGSDLYNFHPDFLKLQRLQITAPARVSKSATLIDANHVLATAVQSVRASVEAGRVPVMLLNDKYLKLAEVTRSLSDLSLAILNSERKEDDIFKQITKTGAIPAEVDAIITTSVFREGNDLYDGRAFDFFVVGQHHSSAIEQLSARARNASEVQVHIIRHDQRKTNSRQFDPIKYADYVANNAQALCNEQNNLSPHDDTSALFFERNLRRAIQYTPVEADQDGRLQVDYFGVNNEVFQAETAHEYKNDAYLISNLQKYGFSVDATIDTSDLQHDSELKEGIKEARGKCKEEKAAAHLAAVETLQKAINPDTLIRLAENAGKVPKAYKFAKDLHKEFGIPLRAAADLLPEVDSPKKFALLKNQITVDCLRENDTYLKSGRIVGLIIQKIDQVFKDGITTSAAELRRMLYQCLSLDKSINLDFLSPDELDKMEVVTANRKAVAILRMFFDVQHSGRDSKRVAKRVHEFTLTPLLKHSFMDTITSEQKTNVEFVARVERSFTGAIIEDAPF